MNNTIQHKSLLVLLALLIGIFATTTANAQATANEVSFENIESYVLNGSLHLSFDVALEGNFLSSGDALHIRPVYRTASGEINLPEIVVNGKQRARFYRRDQSLLSKSKRMENKSFAVMVRNDRERQEVPYSYVMVLPKGVDTKGTLQIEQLLQDCCDLALIDSKPLPLEYKHATPDPAIFVNSVTYITPEAEELKKRDKNVVIRIDYPVGGYQVRADFTDNRLELERLDKGVKELFTNQEQYQIDQVVIRGYASPEDTYGYNLRLSERRASAFKHFLIRRYELPNTLSILTEGVGEDWEGLRKTVEASNMEYKAEVLNIIDTEGVFDGREKKLMDLAGGKPYSYMLKELFPPLRRMEMEVSYTVRPFDTTESENVIKDMPNGLSQREIFDLAQSKDDKDLLKIAAIYFPNNAIANINASSVALVKGNLDEAWTHLSKVEDSPDAYNNLGIYYWLGGDVESAKEYFQKAMAIDSQKDNAVANMKLLERY